MTKKIRWQKLTKEQRDMMTLLYVLKWEDKSITKEIFLKIRQDIVDNKIN